MKIILFACIITSTVCGQANLGIDMAKLAETLRLAGTELRIEDVTKREADARKLPLRSAWIVSAPGHELFFPLVVYTAPKGVLHSAKHEALRKAIREKPPKEEDFGYGLGFFEVPKIGECFVFMEEILISSNNPPRVKGGMPLPAWRPTSKTILSIIGTLESENLDFQIAVLLLNEDEIKDFPAFKSMLYGPDFALPKELASGMVEVIRDSNILIAAESRPNKRPDNDPRGKGGKAEVRTPASQGNTKKREKPDMNSANPGPPLWAWLLGVGVLLVALILLLMGMRRRRSGIR
jgi:hypothetical protein